jgi:hypothetical protein
MPVRQLPDRQLFDPGVTPDRREQLHWTHSGGLTRASAATADHRPGRAKSNHPDTPRWGQIRLSGRGAETLRQQVEVQPGTVPASEACTTLQTPVPAVN